MDFAVLPVTRYKMNCSILWCEQTLRAAVIDPGGDLDEILNFCELMDLTPELALVTHGHFDHAGGAARFAAQTGARIEGPHRGDAHLLARLGDLGAQYGVPAQSFTPARWLDHGDSVHFGDVTLSVLHCPGHCRGHVAYFHEGRRQAFVGDILFRGTIGAWEHADGDLATLIDTIRNRLFALGDDVAFVPGHGPESRFGEERRSNPFVGDAAYARWQARLALQTGSSA
ncbi:MAG: MBL fold metallo-hydrolase [Sphingomonadales bacterium]|nr:MBL fold metallo-hydrolase [Sphingomonadales bacterium]